jgi:mono/diheme cytochrome c family protein
MTKLISISTISLFLILLGLQSFNTKEDIILDKIDISEMPVELVLKNLGNDPYQHAMDRHDESKAASGFDLITRGRTTKDGKKTKRISNHFVCTDCHNLNREFDDNRSEDPHDRLTYAVENKMNFLPGSTFWGIYNRTSFYNGDYDKKYGDLVVGARDTLENAIQLCAKYCSSGRYLEDWELEAIMHYYKKNELLMKDLEISGNDTKNILYYQKLKPEEKERLTEVVNGSFRQSYSATFLPAMDKDKRKYGEGGNASNGKEIYDRSCLHCHANKRVTYLHLGTDKLSARMFIRNMKNYSDKSLYQIIRYGTYSKKGRKQYMPLYTEEKMSDEQINDLIAYLKTLTGK